MCVVYIIMCMQVCMLYAIVNCKNLWWRECDVWVAMHKSVCIYNYIQVYVWCCICHYCSFVWCWVSLCILCACNMFLHMGPCDRFALHVCTCSIRWIASINSPLLQINGLKVKKVLYEDLINSLAFHHCNGTVQIPVPKYKSETQAIEMVRIANTICTQYELP